MSHREYLSELLSIQCEQAQATIRRLKALQGLSAAQREWLEKQETVFGVTSDMFRVAERPADADGGPA